jgi:hypothetical protein
VVAADSSFAEIVFSMVFQKGGIAHQFSNRFWTLLPINQGSFPGEGGGNRFSCSSLYPNCLWGPQTVVSSWYNDKMSMSIKLSTHL